MKRRRDLNLLLLLCLNFCVHAFKRNDQHWLMVTFGKKEGGVEDATDLYVFDNVRNTVLSLCVCVCACACDLFGVYFVCVWVGGACMSVDE